MHTYLRKYIYVYECKYVFNYIKAKFGQGMNCLIHSAHTQKKIQNICF